MNKNLFSQIPSVDKILNDGKVINISRELPHSVVIKVIRNYLSKLRSKIEQQEITSVDCDQIIKTITELLELEKIPSLQPSVNASGIVLHTALGRAPLPKTAIKQLNDTIRHYCTLQIDLETGERGSRYVHIENLLCEITGAEDAVVVNNNAAATMLCLNTLAQGKEVIVSRGQLVEIGGSFRIPDIMKRSNAKMVEVGTTNKTHLFDYENAITENTALLLHVHKSNYRIIGFTSDPSTGEMVKLGNKYNLPVMEDLGSGALVDLSKYGLPKEPMVQDSIRLGAAVCCFSGDKLIGGPQSGVIVGKKEFIQRIKKNQLTRTFRVCKMTLSALEATLKLFLDENKLIKEHPTYRHLLAKKPELKVKAEKLAKLLEPVIFNKGNLEVIDGYSQVGSGSLAGENLPTSLVAIKLTKYNAKEFARLLRYNHPPIITRIQEDYVLLDPRTLYDEEFVFIKEAIEKIISSEGSTFGGQATV